MSSFIKEKKQSSAQRHFAHAPLWLISAHLDRAIWVSEVVLNHLSRASESTSVVDSVFSSVTAAVNDTRLALDRRGRLKSAIVIDTTNGTGIEVRYRNNIENDTGTLVVQNVRDISSRPVHGRRCTNTTQLRMIKNRTTLRTVARQERKCRRCRL
ncbi:hypothetical protein EVAR_47728_1 [Eumeta japonica]|uniref:Uncharacterized protein n=1 Tax=Eumeta variegata TaxID=151549 RepID=A0A4C1VWX3_EUMVA|nr:hypothetical protein EVAR_47728_1 [Eumeta japonica]